MPAVRVRTTLGPETLALPELAPLLGQEVEIRVRRVRKRSDGVLIDQEFLEECRRELAAYGGPIPTLEEVRAANAGIIGSLTDDIRAERDED